MLKEALCSDWYGAEYLRGGGRVPVFLMMLYSEKEVWQLSVCLKAGNEKGGREYESLCVF